MNENYTVYIHINKINKKKYVGITKRKAEKRWKNGRGYNTQTHFYKAIMKYGWENFEHLIYASGLTFHAAENLERFLISKFNSMDPQFGYNKASGGNLNKTVSDETKKKLSSANKKTCGKNHPMFGKHPSNETRKKQSLSHIGKRKGKDNHMYGKKTSDEVRMKNSLAHIGKFMGAENPKARKVICLNTEEVFGSVIEAANKYNIKGRGQHICSCCKGRRTYCGSHPITGEKLQWSYVEEVNDGS